MGRISTLYLDLDALANAIELVTPKESGRKTKKGVKREVEVIVPAFAMSDKLKTSVDISTGEVRDVRAVFKPKEKVVEFNFQKGHATVKGAFETYKSDYIHVTVEWIGETKADRGKKHRISAYFRYL